MYFIFHTQRKKGDLVSDTMKNNSSTRHEKKKPVGHFEMLEKKFCEYKVISLLIEWECLVMMMMAKMDSLFHIVADTFVFSKIDICLKKSGH